MFAQRNCTCLRLTIPAFGSDHIGSGQIAAVTSFNILEQITQYLAVRRLAHADCADSCLRNARKVHLRYRIHLRPTAGARRRTCTRPRHGYHDDGGSPRGRDSQKNSCAAPCAADSTLTRPDNRPRSSTDVCLTRRTPGSRHQSLVAWQRAKMGAVCGRGGVAGRRRPFSPVARPQRSGAG